MYILKWQDQETKETGQGDPHPSLEHLSNLAEEMNREFPNITHWVEAIPTTYTPGQSGMFLKRDGTEIKTKPKGRKG